MGKAKLAICDSDKTYAKNLYEYARKHYSDIYEILLFQSAQVLEEYLNENLIEILLISDDLMYLQEISKQPGYTIYLTTETGGDISGNSIYKYLPAHGIFQIIMSLCTAKQTATLMEEGTGKVKVIGVYSPIKRCFQTTFALTLGQVLATKCKTLYLNFESYSGFYKMECQRVGTDLLDLLYAAEMNPESFNYRVSSFAEHIGNMDYIPPVKVYSKYAEISAEQWINLIQSIRNRTNYEYLILDLTENVNRLVQVLKECDVIYTIQGIGSVAEAKMAQYEWLLREEECESVMKRMKKLKIPEFKEIPHDYELLSYSELAKYVRQVLTDSEMYANKM